MHRCVVRVFRVYVHPRMCEYVSARARVRVYTCVRVHVGAHFACECTLTCAISWDIFFVPAGARVYV